MLLHERSLRWYASPGEPVLKEWLIVQREVMSIIPRGMGSVDDDHDPPMLPTEAGLHGLMEGRLGPRNRGAACGERPMPGFPVVGITLHRHVGLDGRVGVVALEGEVLEDELRELAPGGVEPHPGEGARLA